HSRDAVLAGDHRAVGHRAAHLHDQAAGGEKERRPAGVGRGGDQDLAGLQVGAGRVEDHAREGGHFAGRGGGAAQGVAAGGRRRPWAKRTMKANFGSSRWPPSARVRESRKATSRPWRGLRRRARRTSVVTIASAAKAALRNWASGAWSGFSSRR